MIEIKAWQLDNFGLDNLRLGEIPTPTPKENEILIRVLAVSLNFRDKAIVDGIYEPDMIPKPLIRYRMRSALWWLWAGT